MNGAVEPFVHVSFQRHRMAVIEVQAERIGLELVGERAAGHDLMLGHGAIHRGRMPAMEVHRVRMRSLIHELHANRSPSVARMVGPGTWPL